jgi:hypothetical protein
MLNSDDALHASYSRNMSRETIRKNLIKLAKDKGIQDPEVWPHGDQWAMRFTSRDGEPRQVVLGNVFAKARGAILSLAGTAGKHDDRGVGQRLQQFADSAGFDGGQVRFIGKQYVLFYKGKQLPLGPAGRALGELRRLAGSLLSLAGTSQADQIGALKKKFPGITFTPTPDGRIKARGDNVLVVGKDINDIIKQLKGKQLSSPKKLSASVDKLKPGDKIKWAGKELVVDSIKDMNTHIAVRVKTPDGRVVSIGSFPKGKQLSLAKKPARPSGGQPSAEWFLLQGIKSKAIAEKAAALVRQGVNPMDVLRQAKDREKQGYTDLSMSKTSNKRVNH